MPPIKHTDLFDFKAYDTAIKDVREQSKRFGHTMENVTKRINERVGELVGKLNETWAVLAKMNVAQTGAGQSLQNYATQIDKTTQNLSSLKAAQAGLRGAVDANKASVSELMLEYKGLKKMLSDLKRGDENYQRQLEAIKNRMREVTPAIKAYAETLRQTKNTVAAAEGSYKKMQQQLTALRNTLRNMPNAFNPVTGAINKSNKQAVAMQMEIQRLDRALKNADKSMGLYARNVGNYGSAMGSSISKFARVVGMMLGITSAFEAGRFFLRTNIEMDSLDRKLKVVSGTLGEFATNQEYVREISDKFGLSINELTNNFAKYYSASTTAGFSAEETRETFEKFAKAFANLRLSTDQQNSAFLALEQIMSKGKLSAEELRRQLGNVLPGAAEQAAKALGVTTAELESMLRKGEVLSEDFLPKFADQLVDTFGKEEHVQGLQAAIVRLNNAIKDLTYDSEGHLNRLLGKIIDFATKGIKAIDQITGSIGNAIFSGKGVFQSAVELGAFQTDEVQKSLKANVGAFLEQYKRVDTEISQMTQHQIKRMFGADADTEKAIAIQKERLIQRWQGLHKEASDAYKKFIEKNKDRLFIQLNDDAKKQGAALFAQMETYKRAIEQAPGTIGGVRVQPLETGRDYGGGTDRTLQNAKSNISKLQRIAQKAAELEIEENELKLVRMEIDQEEFERRRLEIKKTYVERVIALEESLGSNADQSKISGFQKEQMEAEKRMSAFLIGEWQRRQDVADKINKEGFDLYQQQLDERAKKIEATNQKIEDAHEKHLQRMLAAEDKAFSLLESRGRANFSQEIAYLKRRIAIKLRHFKDASEEKLRIAHLEADKERALNEQTMRLAIEAAHTVVDVLANNARARSEGKIKRLEEEKEKELAIAGSNAAAREAIEKRYQEKINQEKTKQAKNEQTAALARVGIETAVSVAKTASLWGFPAAWPFIAIAVAQGALQAAVIKSTPLPKYATGTKSAKKGQAVVGEEGFELVERNGRMFVTPGKPTLVTLQGGEKITPHEESKKILETAMKAQEASRIADSGILHDNLARQIRSGKQSEAIGIFAKALERNMTEESFERAMTRALRNMPQTDFNFDERGYHKYQKELNQRIEYLNRKH